MINSDIDYQLLEELEYKNSIFWFFVIIKYFVQTRIMKWFNIVFVQVRCNPYAKVVDPGDVVQSLPEALRKDLEVYCTEAFISKQSIKISSL